MGIGVSIFLIAVGSILAFALEADAEGINLDTVGVILIILGLIGLAVTALFWTDWAPPRRRRADVYVDDDPVVRRRLVDLGEPVVQRRRVVEVDRPVVERTTTRGVYYDDGA
jgi:hypothetical protein